MKHTITLLNVVVATTFALGLVRPETVLAQNVCSVATLQGDYIMTGQADFPPKGSEDPTTYPRLTLGVATFDGKGNVSTSLTLAQGGDIVRLVGTGAYTLNDDCRGTFTGGTNWDIVVTRDGRMGEFIRTDDGHVARRTIKRQ